MHARAFAYLCPCSTHTCPFSTHACDPAPCTTRGRRCVDLVGRKPEGLRGELLLTERDYGQLLGETEAAPQPAPLEAAAPAREGRVTDAAAEAAAEKATVKVRARRLRALRVVPVTRALRATAHTSRTAIDLGNASLHLAARLSARRARVLVLDAATGSADLRELGTISDLAAAVARRWAPCRAGAQHTCTHAATYATQCAHELGKLHAQDPTRP